MNAATKRALRSAIDALDGAPLPALERAAAKDRTLDVERDDIRDVIALVADARETLYSLAAEAGMEDV